MNFKAIIFDYDDTLVKTKASKIPAIVKTAKQFYNLDLDLDEINKLWGKPIHELFTLLFKESDTVENIINNYKTITVEFEMIPYEGSLDFFIKNVDSKKIGMVTSTSRALIINDLQRLGFSQDKFFKIQTAEDTLVHKPNPEVFDPILLELNKLGIGKEDTVYIGDLLIDYQAATSAGLHFIGMAHQPESQQVFSSIGAKYVKSFEELDNLVS